MPYEQLSERERYVICHLHRYGLTHAEIGRRLNRHRGTIGRELTPWATSVGKPKSLPRTRPIPRRLNLDMIFLPWISLLPSIRPMPYASGDAYHIDLRGFAIHHGECLKRI